MPAGATDTHFHLFGPQAAYPLVPVREYTPPLITPALARRLFAKLGIERAVVIQPSVYGDDNRAQLEGAREVGIPTRAVVVARYETSDRELARLHDEGARGLRFVLAHPGGLPLADLERWAERIHGLGWHIQLLAKGAQLLELAPRLEKLACPAVIDHIGMIRPADGITQPAFQAVLRLLARGHWVKLSGAYRLSPQRPPYPDLIPYVAELMAARPDRIVWASDWPHAFVKGAMPNTTDLLDLLADWVPDEGRRQRILVDNPAALYGF
ncbi:MAG TPA: amidohydrolase family protein [Geminicoccaceae bacterium]|nr:amidohydrolase family protein [Geminicoccaceae bacterium]